MTRRFPLLGLWFPWWFVVLLFPVIILWWLVLLIGWVVLLALRVVVWVVRAVLSAFGDARYRSRKR